ncbi:MAG: argininosuccinate lyase [Smithellaceae bacterium]|nr:argininosuccinate lyase [Smithellaceae bacterium]
MTKTRKPWGGRFQADTDEEVEAFTSSLAYDRRLYRHDIAGSIAHAKMLTRQGIISAEEGKLIISGLKGIRRDIETARVNFHADDEDIHMAVEKLLIERIGEAGGKLHTGRSRNDQIALDLRLYLRDEIKEIHVRIEAFQGVLLALAKAEKDTILPGYTHLQKAQPVLLAHYFLAYWEMLDRDAERLRDCQKRANVLPLGVAALAGTSLPLDRAYTAKLLSFPKVSRNSLDTVADRDFLAEFTFSASLIMMHLSRLCEDLILWSSDEFRFIEIGDAFTTGSNIMPQKKNPDVAELIRGKTGRVYGNLVALLTLLKGLPMSYNRDLQEDKEPFFDTVDTVKASLQVLTKMMRNIRFDRERMLAEAGRGFSTATDIAEYLVIKGIPFREAHGIVGRIVRYCLDGNKTLSDLTLEEFRTFYQGFEEGIFECIEVVNSVRSKRVIGGTSHDAVHARLKAMEKDR